jgi:hypothetical protein
MHRLGLFAMAAGVALILFTTAGCFSPRFDRCAVTCGAQDQCPEGLFCLRDGKCHATEDDQLCTVIPGGDGSPGSDGSMPGDDGGTRPDGGGTPDANVVIDAGPPVRPTPGDIVISEIHKNPEAAGDPLGEWFEVTNVTDSILDFSGLRMSDNAGEFFIQDELLVGPRGRLVFGFSPNEDENGGVEVDFAYGDAPLPIQLANDNEDNIDIVDTLGAEQFLDSVAFDSVSFPSIGGRSMSLDPDSLDAVQNNDGASWCDGQEPPYSDNGDLGTPGAANPQCPEPAVAPPSKRR